MTLPVFVLPEAEAELLAAQAWYDDRALGLGDRFFATIDTVVLRISRAPQQFPLIHADLRRALVPNFPYALFFRVESEGIYLLACRHARRRPIRRRRPFIR